MCVCVCVNYRISKTHFIRKRDRNQRTGVYNS